MRLLDQLKVIHAMTTPSERTEIAALREENRRLEHEVTVLRGMFDDQVKLNIAMVEARRAWKNDLLANVEAALQAATEVPHLGRIMARLSGHHKTWEEAISRVRRCITASGA